jgi:type I restriction enzyme, S subunit
MSWAYERLSSLGEVVTGATPSTSVSDYYGGKVPFVTPVDLDKSEPILSASRTLSELGARKSRILPPDTVMVCCIGATIGKVGIAGRQLCTNQQINSVIFDPRKILPRYGYYACRRLRPILRSISPSTTVPIVSKSKFMDLAIPLPPIVEQRRIVEVLDRMDRVLAKRRKAISLFDDLAQSIFLDMFGNLSELEVSYLGDIADICSGITKGRRIAAKVPLRSVPYLAVLNVQDKRLDLSYVKTIDVTESEVGRYRLVKNDLLLTEGGDPDKLGRGTLWNNEIPDCIHQNHIFRVRIRPASPVEPMYLNWLVSSKYGKRYFLGSAKQTTGIASINSTQLHGFPVPVPPRPLQAEFTEKIKELSRLIGVHSDHLKGLETLLASLDLRAFRGEL